MSGNVILTENPSYTYPHHVTGLPIFDNTYGSPYDCPGLPKGRLVLVQGASAQGKSLVALAAAGNLCGKGARVAYVDLNGSIDPDYAESLGVPLSDLFQFMCVQPSTLMEGMQIMGSLLKVVDVIFLDGLRDTPTHAWDGVLAALKVQLQDHGTALVALGDKVPLAWKYHAHRSYQLHSFKAPGTLTFDVCKDALDRGVGRTLTFEINHGTS